MNNFFSRNMGFMVAAILVIVVVLFFRNKNNGKAEKSLSMEDESNKVYPV